MSPQISPKRVISETPKWLNMSIRFQAASKGWLVRGLMKLMKMSVGYIEDEEPQARPRAAFWSTGGISPVELIAAVGILAIMVGIMAGAMAR
jgi:hypothetical protein